MTNRFRTSIRFVFLMTLLFAVGCSEDRRGGGGGGGGGGGEGRCWGPLLQDGSGHICWPDCESFECEGVCDDDGSCVPSNFDAPACDPACSEFCPAG